MQARCKPQALRLNIRRARAKPNSIHISWLMRTGLARSGLALTLLLIELTLLLGGGVLVLLVLRDEVVHVALCLCEFHLVHALACVPMQEGLAAEHGGEILGHSLEHLLDGSGIARERDSHLQALWRDVADGSLDVLGDPLNEVRAVLVAHIEHLLID